MLYSCTRCEKHSGGFWEGYMFFDLFKGNSQRNEQNTAQNHSVQSVNQSRCKKMQCIVVNGGVPVLWENGKIFYAVENTVIGSYDLPKYEDGEFGMVKNRKGEDVARIQWDTVKNSCTGYFCNYRNGIFELPDKLQTINENEQLRDRALEALINFHNQEKLKIAWQVFARRWDGIIDTRNNTQLVKNGILEADGRISLRPNIQEVDVWGMLAAYLCYQEFDPAATFNDAFYVKF